MLVNNIAAVNTDVRILLKNIFLIFGIKMRPFLLFDHRNFLFSMWHLEIFPGASKKERSRITGNALSCFFSYFLFFLC